MAIFTIDKVLALADNKKCCAMIYPFTRCLVIGKSVQKNYRKVGLIASNKKTMGQVCAAKWPKQLGIRSAILAENVGDTG